jgi:hypothetical protein
MKKIMLLLAVMLFASPALAQDYQAYGLNFPYQLYQLDEPSQQDQSFRFYQPYEIQKQQSQSNKVQTKHSNKHINTTTVIQPVDKK